MVFVKKILRYRLFFKYKSNTIEDPAGNWEMDGQSAVQRWWFES